MCVSVDGRAVRRDRNGAEVPVPVPPHAARTSDGRAGRRARGPAVSRRGSAARRGACRRPRPGPDPTTPRSTISGSASSPGPSPVLRGSTGPETPPGGASEGVPGVAAGSWARAMAALAPRQPRRARCQERETAPPQHGGAPGRAAPPLAAGHASDAHQERHEAERHGRETARQQHRRRPHRAPPLRRQHAHRRVRLEGRHDQRPAQARRSAAAGRPAPIPGTPATVACSTADSWSTRRRMGVSGGRPGTRWA